MSDDGRLLQAKALPITEVADRLGIAGLKRAGVELVGPCPVCGGRDRFGLNPGRGVFNCRHCGGGDGLALVRLVLACDFRAALDWLVGAADVRIPEAERRRREARLAREAARRQPEEDRRRDQAIARGRAIWDAGLPLAGTPAEAYLRGRAIRLDAWPPCLRVHPALPYMHQVDGDWRELHRGPAMLAAIQAPSGKFLGVHRTWIDPDRPGQKARIVHAGEVLPAKKVEGSVKGGAIRLTHAKAEPFDTLVMGEGIETTLSPLVAGAHPGAAFWAGVSLGNMAGRRVLTRAGAEALGLDPTGIRAAGIPDMSDSAAFVPPRWVRRLVYLQDGDSDPVATRAHLLAGLRRAQALRPGLEARIAAAPAGCDWNDVLRSAHHA